MSHVQMTPRISIIVPVFKAEAYLSRCVDSILAQTFTDFELWLVDDGSPDSSGRICDDYAAKDARIHVVHKKNGGASDARNVGMEKATGAFIGFVDSDDVIEPRMYELLHGEALEKGAEIVECLLDKYDDVGEIQKYDGAAFDSEVFGTEDALKEVILERKLHQTPVNKLYKAEVARTLPFVVGKICEDEYWTYRVVGAAKTIVSMDVVLYHYYQSADSVMRQRYSAKRLSCVSAFEERATFMKERYPRLYPLANKSYLHACFFHYQMICANSDIDGDMELRNGLYRRFMEGDYRGLLELESPKQWLWYRLFMAFPEFTCRLRNLLKIGL